MMIVRSLLLAALLAASAAEAQVDPTHSFRYGVAVGLPVPSVPLESMMLAGRTAWYPSKRINVRGEVSGLLHVLDRVALETPPCPSVCPPSPPEPPTSLAGLSAHMIVNDDYVARGESGGYYILGGGVYRGASPSAVGSLGGAIEGGVGFRFISGAGSLEVKYVRIRHWIGGQHSFVPVTLGVSW
jgi:hypothetical protein